MLEFIAGLLPQFAVDFWDTLPSVVQYLATTLFKILILTVGVILCVAFSTYFERKVIGSMQARVGPNRVGPLRLAAAVCGRHQAADQGSHCSVEVEQVPVRYCAIAVADSRAGGLGCYPDERLVRHC